ncbi:MAG: haloacid dehalogenase-like hydrolase [Alphaproteobacteria bacterium]|nr:haloacid dehalogenase-like hydrolase [Alphaproteobacteria bacterium]
MPVAFFDLDGTLSSLPASEALLVGLMLREGHLGPNQMAAAALNHLRLLPLGFGVAMRLNKGYVAGLAVERIEELGRRVADILIARHMRPTVLRRLDEHRAAGDIAVLITGSPDFVAAPLARALGIGHCIATVCPQGAGRFLAHPPSNQPFGGAKLELARAFCAERGLALNECAAYADSLSDAPLLAAVGRPVAVWPDICLRRLAEVRDWPIMGAGE